MSEQRKKRRITDFFGKKGEKGKQPKNQESPIISENEYDKEQQTADSAPSPMESENASSTASTTGSSKPHEFQMEWLKKWPWLRFDEKTGLMTCAYCIDNKLSNKMTQGCSNFRTSTIDRHLKSADHKLSLVAQTEQKNLRQSVQNVFSQQESAIISAMNTVYWLAKENIASEKYPSLLDLLEKQGCEHVKNLNVAQNASYRSTSIASELQEAIANTIMSDIMDSMKDALCVAIMTDESTDISVTGKLILYARFVDKNFSVKTHFLGNFNIGEKDATSITEVLIRVMTNMGIPPEKILCLGSDGASVMTGVKNGVAAKIRRLSPYLINIHCVAHRLALCTSQAASNLDQMQQYKTVLTNLYYYFKSSSVRSSRLAHLQELLESPQIKMREMHDIRWFSFYNVLEGVYKTWSALVTYFDSTELSKDPKATGLRKALLQYKFVAITWGLMDVIPVVTTLNLIFQKDSLDVVLIQPAVESAISKLEYLKTHDGHYTQELKELLGEGESLCGHSLENVTQQKQVPASTLKKFIDNLIDNLRKRFPSESVSVISSFDCLAMRDLSFIPKSDVQQYGLDKLKILTNHYGVEKCDNDGKPHSAFIEPNATKEEYSLLKTLVLQQNYPRDQLPVLWKIIYECHKDIFPNLLKLATIALTVPVQTAVCERGFSVQNNIKTANRNRLGEETMRRLMTICIEGPPLKNFDPKCALDEFKTKKSRRIFSKFM